MINSCMQKEGEDVDLYYHRLTEVSDIHSGLNPPDDGNNDSPYEQQLKNAFLQGCLPQISSFVTKHMVDHHTSRLASLRDWARHAEEHFNNKKKSKKGLNFLLEGEDTTVYVMKESRDTDKSRNRGRGSRGGEKSRSGEYDACFLCGTMGNWARECRVPRLMRKDREEAGQLLLI